MYRFRRVTFALPRVLAWLAVLAYGVVLVLGYGHWRGLRAEGHDLTWVETVLAILTFGEVLLVYGTVVWYGNLAAWIRVVGVFALVAGALGTVSASLLVAPLAFLALPSLRTFERPGAARERVAANRGA